MAAMNPAMNEKTFTNPDAAGLYNDIMTLEGTVSKSIYLLGILLTAGVLGWKVAISPSLSQYAHQILVGGGFLALVVALVTIFKQEMAPTTAPAY
ncbi:MAG: Bax inhibitor-1/YccA family protein, partial [Bacteroidota bacterium]